MTIYAYESFEYANGLELRTGLATTGFGWNGGWYTSLPKDYFGIDSEVLTPGLEYPAMYSVGGKVVIWTKSDGNVYQQLARTLLNPIQNINGTTLWVSFLIGYNIDNKSDGKISFPGLTTDAAGTIEATPFYASGRSGVASVVYFDHLYGPELFYGDGYKTTHLMMFKIDMYGPANPVNIYAYVDPILTNDPSTWSPSYSFGGYYIPVAITKFRWYSGRASSLNDASNWLDEIRFANTPLGSVGVNETMSQFFPYLRNNY